MSESLADSLVAAISAQDPAGISVCFADSTMLELTAVTSKQVGDRLHIAYCFTGVEDDEPFVVEQQLYCTVADGRIERAGLLRSGFRPPRTA